MAKLFNPADQANVETPNIFTPAKKPVTDFSFTVRRNRRFMRRENRAL